MTNNKEIIEYANSKLVLLGKRPMYLEKNGYICIDLAKVETPNLKINNFVTGIINSENSYENIIIETIEFGSNIKFVDKYSFSFLKSLKSISDLDKVENLNAGGLFNMCKSLKIAPKLPENVTNMSSTYSNCLNLEYVPNIPSNVTDMSYTFYCCDKIKEFPLLPNNVECLIYTFSECSSIEKAPIIPEKVESLYFTFMDCESLKEPPIIPYGVKQMEYTFNGCEKLESSPEIPDSVKSMKCTFNLCKSLKKPPSIIPDSVENMTKTFYKCESLTGDLVINANPISFQECLYKAGTGKGAELRVVGNSKKIKQFIQTIYKDN